MGALRLGPLGEDLINSLVEMIGERLLGVGVEVRPAPTRPATHRMLDVGVGDQMDTLRSTSAPKLETFAIDELHDVG